MVITSKASRYPLDKWVAPFLVLLAAAAVASVVVVYSWFAELKNVVQSRPVGVFVSADFISTMTQTRTRVETTSGIFLVDGVFPLIKGDAAVMEERKDMHRYLCDTAANICNQMP